LASDVQAGALVIEVLTGLIAFVGDSPEPDSGLTIAAIGLMVGCNGLRKLAAAATDPFPRGLRWIATHPAETLTMRLWLHKEKPERKARLAPAEANDSDWLELDLQRGQDLRGLIGVTSGTRVEVFQGLRRDGGWCVIRVPDGRLLWPAKRAVSHHPSLGVDLAAHEPTPSDGPAAVTTSATPTTTATADTPSREPSLSCLLYLSYLSTNKVLYGVTYRVNTKTIAATILAAGFLSLRDLGSIELDYASPPESHPPVKDAVTVMPLRRIELPGIPGEILNALQPWREPVTTAADRMNDGAGVFGERMKLAVERELIALGYYRYPIQPDDHRTHRLRAVARRLGAGYRASPQPDYQAVATLHEARAQARSRWQQFETTEPLLFRALMQACQWGTRRVD
jgi:hypothetical protein